MTHEHVVGLWEQAVWNGRIGVLTLTCLLAILVLKVVIYRFTTALLRDVREMVAECRSLTLDVRRLMTATRAQATAAATATERATATAERTAASAEAVLGKLDRAAGDSGHALPAMPTAPAWHPGDPDRRNHQ